MNQPPLDKLTERIDSKYTLVVLAAKRARMLTESGELDSENLIKPVSQALHEIAAGKITYEQPKTNGIK